MVIGVTNQGLRSEVKDDLGPRIGVSWAPLKSGRTTLRASAGVFYDFLAQTTLEQSIRVDGTHEQELNIVNPAYPNPGTSAVLPPVNRYFLDPDLRAPRSTRFSGGIEQTLHASPTWSVRLNGLYAYTRTEDAWRGLNENALVNGVRPDSRFANVVDVVPDESARQHQLTLAWNIGLPPQPPGYEMPQWFMWKRFAFYGNYVVTSAYNNTDGDFLLPPGGTLSDQWGRSALDIPSRLTFQFISLQFKRTQISGTLNIDTRSKLTYVTAYCARVTGEPQSCST